MKLPLVVLAAAVVGACAAHAQTPAVTAKVAMVTAELKNPAGQSIGTAMVTDAPKGVMLRIEAKGLTPGWHGLHFHEKGDCSKSDFTSAGGHTHAGGDRVHGLLNPKANETGDLPNLFVDTHGAGVGEFYSTLVTLKSLRDADGSAVVIHAGPDDHMAQPIGGAGARVACAVIR